MRSESLASTLLAHGAITEDELRRIESYVLGVPFVSLRDLRIDLEVLSLIPEPISRTHNLIAYAKEGDTLAVAVLDVEDLAALESLRSDTQLTITPRLTDTASMRSALLRYQRALKEAYGEIIMKEARSEPNDLSAARIVDTLLQHAITQGASDVHLESSTDALIVRYRINGALYDAMTLPHALVASVAARIKRLARLASEHEVPQEGRFKVQLEGQPVAFRVSTVPTCCGEKIVMRVVRTGRSGFSLEGIGFHGAGLESVHRALTKQRGIILVTGPQHSGKTTTLYTLLDLVNTPAVSAATIESRIEYQMPRVSQTQVRPESGLTFAAGLRAIARQDADIIMISDIRDRETALQAVHAAQSGRLVLAAVSEPSADAARAYLEELGVPAQTLASAVPIVVVSRLARRLSSEKESYFLSEEERQTLATHANLDRVLAALKEERRVPADANWHSIPLYRPARAEYQGYVGIHEVAAAPGLRSDAALSLFEDGVFKAVIGLTTLEEAYRVCRDTMAA